MSLSVFEAPAEDFYCIWKCPLITSDNGGINQAFWQLYSVFPSSPNIPPPSINWPLGRTPSATVSNQFFWVLLEPALWDFLKQGMAKVWATVPPTPLFLKSDCDCAQIQPFVVMRIQTHFKCIYNYLSLAWIFSSIWFWWIIIHLFRKNQHSSKIKKKYKSKNV